MNEDEDYPIVMDGDDDVEAAEDDDAYDDPTTPSIQRQRRKSVMKSTTTATTRRRRRSSARFLRLTSINDGDVGGGDDQGDLLLEGTLDSTLTKTSHQSSSSTTSATNLGEVYQKAIRMNAENKINATNSWNLSLIDHLDRFIAHDIDDGNTNTANGNKNRRGGGGGGSRSNNTNPSFGNSCNNNMEETLTTASLATGINFTKASCTLDASVKIYSYRVDDVHLSSYRVLANLNRTDNGKDNHSSKSTTTALLGTNGSSDGIILGSGGDDDGDERNDNNRSSKKTGTSVETLEHNLANINIHKLDAAFDIDPLFHKMSKTFDEGGAKGLLLANLGVSRTGCNIVFDSTLDDEKDITMPSTEEDASMMKDNDCKTSYTRIDVSSLASKLDSLLSGLGQSIHQVPLVPQLASLRQDYAVLEQEGFIEHDKPTDRYASSPDEEVEADRSIHMEAIERSRASVARSFLMHRSQDYHPGGSVRSSLESDPGHYAPDDFGAGGDDFDDEDYGVSGGGEGEFGKSLIHDGDHRFSSSSFQASFVDPQQAQPSQATVLLDAIASGKISTFQSSNPYEYFNSQALYNLSSMPGGNLWAGAEHWKKMSSSTIKRRKPGMAGAGVEDVTATATKPGVDGKKTRGRKAKAGNSDRPVLVDITRPVENLEEILRKPKKSGGKSKTAGGNDPFLLTKTMKAKYGKIDNLLPLDAGLGIEQLTSLFLRPSTNLADVATQKSINETGVRRKTVGFSGIDTMGHHNNNTSYEDNDDDGGTGFDFGGGGDDDGDGYGDDTQDFVIPELDDVRKVEKVRVGYATVAKKVDVKRLKMDLWNELERTFQKKKEDADDGEGKNREGSKEHDNDDDAPNSDTGGDRSTTNESPSGVIPLSFQSTLREMQSSQSQRDVTLPFYFICILHLCNEKGLALESCGLDDFVIHSGSS